MHHKIQAVDKEKERLKDQVMKTGTVNYVKVINKQYGLFFTFLNMAKKNFINAVKEKPIILLESADMVSEASISSFRKIEISEFNIKKYKEKYPRLSHVRTGNDIKGFIFVDDSDKVAGYYAVDTSRDYIIAIEVSPHYRRQGLAKKMLSEAHSKYKAKHLSVNKHNDAAIKLYQSSGFKINDDDDTMLYMTCESIGDVLCKCPHCEALIGYTEDNPEHRCYRCGKNYRGGEDSEYDIVTESDYQSLYHLSNRDISGVVLRPRIPSNYFTKNGFEDNKTMRVCFSKSIDGALMAMSQNLEGKELYVHVPRGRVKSYTPSSKQVPDAKVTDEVWVKTPTEVQCIGKIKVYGPTGPDIKFEYGSGQIGTNGKWSWTWIDRKNISMESSLNQSYLKPVFILLTYTDSLMAKTIKAVTKQPYSHAGISLDSTLSHIFTYGRKTAEDICKFTDENIFSGILGENKSKIQYALYVTFFNNNQIKVLTQHIENIKNDIKRQKYSYKGLINFAFGRETHDDGMFCSQFVASVIKAGDPKRLKRDASLYSPTDLREVHGMHFVTRGILGNYNKAKVDETVEKIKANLVVTECNEIIDSVMPRIDERILDSQNDIVEFANIVNGCTDIISLKDTKNYLDNEFCKPIIDSRINKIISESTNISKESNSMYIILETSQERLVNGKIIAFNPNDKDTKLYTVTEQVVDSAARFCTNKYSKSLNKVILEESNTSLPDNDDRVDVGFKIKASPETIGYITENFTNVKLSPNLHTGVVLDTRDSEFLVHYMSSVLESIGVSNVDIERYN